MARIDPAPAVPPGPAPEANSRAASGLARWRRRSRVVYAFRYGLPWLMAALVVLTVGWIAVRSVLSALAPKQTGTEIRMSRPKFYGRDDQGKPYVIAASSAVRDAHDPNLIALTDTDMNLNMGGPVPGRVRSRTGLYDEGRRVLSLHGHVVLEDGKGYTYVSDEALIDMQTDEVRGSRSVTGVGPLGRILASSYAVHDRGQHVVFAGDVHTHLNNGRTQTPP